MKTPCLFLTMSLSFAACAVGQAPPVYQAPAPAQPAPPPAATPAPPPSAPPKRSAADLEKLVAPIALHPDPLIAIILPASVYPLEIVQAARFVKDTNNIPKVDTQPWDDNVKALAKFPAMIQTMNDDLTWTMDLGQAFLDQQKELMDTIQALRAKANSAGVLKTTPQQVIVVTNTIIEKTVQQQVVFVTNTIVQIQPSNPQVIYVPTYPPTIYYPPPVYVGPPPAVTFAAGIAVGLIIANNCDWHGGGVYHSGSYHGGDVTVNRNVNVNTGNINTGNINTGNRAQTTTAGGAQQKWQPDQSRMSKSGAAGTTAGANSAQARGWGSGGAGPSTGSAAARPSAGTAAARPSTGTAGARPSTGTPSASRPAASPSVSRPSPAPSAAQPRSSPPTSRPASSGSAFGGASSGGGARAFSSRGASSRSSGGGSRGGGGGGRR